MVDFGCIRTYLPSFQGFPRCLETVLCATIIVFILRQDVDGEPEITNLDVNFTYLKSAYLGMNEQEYSVTVKG